MKAVDLLQNTDLSKKSGTLEIINLYQHTKMDIKIIKFDQTEIEKYKFHQQKNSISIYDLHTNEIKKLFFKKGL